MNKDNLVSFLGQLEPFKGIPPNARATFATKLTFVSLAVKNSYQLTRSPEQYYLLPLYGSLILQKSRISRSRPFCRLLPLGGLWPIRHTEETERTIAVYALTKGAIGIITNEDLRCLCQQTAVLRAAFINSIGLAWQRITEDADIQANHPLSVRLAQVLLDLSQGQGQEIIVPHTHEQISLLLNSNRETVSALISRFRQLGWLESRSRSLQLLDIPVLSNATQDDWFVRQLNERRER